MGALTALHADRLSTTTPRHFGSTSESSCQAKANVDSWATTQPDTAAELNLALSECHLQHQSTCAACCASDACIAKVHCACLRQECQRGLVGCAREYCDNQERDEDNTCRLQTHHWMPQLQRRDQRYCDGYSYSDVRECAAAKPK